MKRTDLAFDVFGRAIPAINPWDGDETNRDLLARMKEALRAAIDDELTARQREIVLSFFYENKSNKEIAEQLGVDKSTVSRHLSRAVEKLKKSLKHGVFKMWEVD